MEPSERAQIRVPFCDLRAAHAWRGTAIESALLRVARSGRYVLGPEVEAFELEWAALCRSQHAIGVGNGTDALALILRAAGIGAATRSSCRPTPLRPPGWRWPGRGLARSVWTLIRQPR